MQPRQPGVHYSLTAHSQAAHEDVARLSEKKIVDFIDPMASQKVGSTTVENFNMKAPDIEFNLQLGTPM